MNDNMHAHSIKVYARLKNDSNCKKKVYDIIRKHKSYEDIFFYKNLRGENHGISKFRFNLVFDYTKDQKEIFETVAQPVVTSVLQGFNATIFAYGQTGSGKTYTMTGSTKKYEERGITPRSLQHIFSEIEKYEDKPTLYISYMEIYNEICYDLLSPRENRNVLILEELPRVMVLEDKKGQARLKNLSVLPVSTEEEAMRLLFLGDTNRAIAETPLNEYSSRSHCIFTIYIMAKSHDNQTMTYSKLNLVDLAGSERVHKSCITGNILNEAKHINLSLHFLQQVILALSETKRTHIPYRNSVLTFILKDSLGGNCLTVMFATLALSANHIQETISTCKFAQRVALIKTVPIVNEVSDPQQEILLLKNEIQELRKQLGNIKPASFLEKTFSISSKQKEDTEMRLENYLKSNKDEKPEISPALYQFSFQFFKNKIITLENKLEEKNKKTSNDKEDFHENKPFMELEGAEISQHQINSEVEDYLNLLSQTYERAKTAAATIERCQVNINKLRERLDEVSETENFQQKFLLAKELNHQQGIYRENLIQLKMLKTETLQLETGLAKAKAKLMSYKKSGSEQTFKNLQKSCNLCEDTWSIHAADISTGYSTDIQAKCNCYVSHLSPERYEESKTTKLLPLNNIIKHDIENTIKKFNYCNRRTNNYFNACCCGDNTQVNSDCHIKCFEVEDSCQKNNNFCFFNCTGNSYIRYENQNHFNHRHKSLFPHRRNLIEHPENRCSVIEHFDDKISTDKNVERIKCDTSTCCLENNLSLCTNHMDSIKFQMSNYSTDYRSNIVDGQSECYCDANNFPICKLQTTAHKKIQEPNQTMDKLNKTTLVFNSENHLNSEFQVIPDKLCRSAEAIKEINKEIFEGNGTTNLLVVEKTGNLSQTFSENSKGPIPNETLNNKYEIFLDTDNENFKNFMSNIPLTGNEDIDKEICNFYRAKMGN